VSCRYHIEKWRENYGIIPRFMLEQGWSHKKVDHIVVETMHERKKKLAENADAIIALSWRCRDYGGIAGNDHTQNSLVNWLFQL